MSLRNTELVSNSISDGPDGGQAPFWGHLQHASVNIHGVCVTNTPLVLKKQLERDSNSVRSSV